MGFFKSREEKQRIKEETERILKEADWRREQEVAQIANLARSYGCPEKPLGIEVKNNTFHLLNGRYEIWCNGGKLYFKNLYFHDLVLFERDDWNKQSITELGLNNGEYNIVQINRDKRVFDVYPTTPESRFQSINLSDILAVSEKGDLISQSKVTGAKFVTNRNVKVESKIETHDSRMGIIVVNHPARGQYEIAFAYQQFEAVKALIESNKKNVETVSSNSSANISVLKELKELLDAGIITQEEFDAKKSEILSRV